MTAELSATVDHARKVAGAGESDIDPEMETLGLRHEVLQIGAGSYLEICTPIDVNDETPGSKFLRRAGDGGYMLVLEVSSADELRERLRNAGLAIPLQQTYHGNELTQVHPRDFGTLVEADEIRDGNSWHYPALEPQPTVGITTGILAAELAVSDIGTTVGRWIGIFDAVPINGSSIWLPGGGVVRFVDAAGQRSGPVSVDIASSLPEHVGRSELIAGVTVNYR